LAATGLAGVVDRHDLDLLAADAAGAVDLLDGGLHAFLDHVAVLRQRTGGGDHHGDLDLRVCGGQQRGASQAQRGDEGGHAERNVHEKSLQRWLRGSEKQCRPRRACC
jgi:hypothetical protein